MSAIGAMQLQSNAFIEVLPTNFQNRTASRSNVNDVNIASRAPVAAAGGPSNGHQPLRESHNSQALAAHATEQPQQSDTAPARDADVEKLYKMVADLSQKLSALVTENDMLRAANGDLSTRLTAKRTPGADAVSGAYPNRANGSNGGSTGSSSLFGDHLKSMAPSTGNCFGGFPGKSNGFALGGLVGMGLGSSLIGALLLGGLMF